jgi:hypothetical protein
MGKKARTNSAPRPGEDGGISILRNRYYVQHLAEHVFVIRERMAEDGEPGPNDCIARSFANRDDAYRAVSEMNETRRKLDEHNEAENDVDVLVGDDKSDLFRELGQQERGK